MGNQKTISMEKLLILILHFWQFLQKDRHQFITHFQTVMLLGIFILNLIAFSNGKGDENYSIILSGDTIINSKTYHKLTTPLCKNLFSTGTCGGKTTGYKGAIREDKAQLKVFYTFQLPTRPKNYFTILIWMLRTLWKDIFSLLVCQQQIYVISIDSVLVGSTYRIPKMENK